MRAAGPAQPVVFMTTQTVRKTSPQLSAEDSRTTAMRVEPEALAMGFITSLPEPRAPNAAPFGLSCLAVADRDPFPLRGGIQAGGPRRIRAGLRSRQVVYPYLDKQAGPGTVPPPPFRACSDSGFNGYTCGPNGHWDGS